VGELERHQRAERMADHRYWRVQASLNQLGDVERVVGRSVAGGWRVALTVTAQIRRDGGKVRQQAPGKRLEHEPADAESVQHQDGWRRWVDDAAHVELHAPAGQALFAPLHQRQPSKAATLARSVTIASGCGSATAASPGFVTPDKTRMVRRPA